MKKIVLFICLVATFGIRNSATAQDKPQKNPWDDLLILYVDEKYDKLLTKAESYTNADKTTKEPMPYLYASKAYYEMSKNEKYAKDYPPEKALKAALKYAAKYRKKDKEGQYFDDNKDYFDELKEVTLEEAENLVMKEDWIKAKRNYDAITDFDPADAGAWMLLGYVNLKQNITEGKLNIKKSAELFRSLDFKSLSYIDKRCVKFGLINYAQFLKTKGLADSARTTLNLGLPYLKDDKEYSVVVDDMK